MLEMGAYPFYEQTKLIALDTNQACHKWNNNRDLDCLRQLLPAMRVKNRFSILLMAGATRGVYMYQITFKKKLKIKKYAFKINSFNIEKYMNTLMRPWNVVKVTESGMNR